MLNIVVSDFLETTTTEFLLTGLVAIQPYDPALRPVQCSHPSRESSWPFYRQEAAYGDRRLEKVEIWMILLAKSIMLVSTVFPILTASPDTPSFTTSRRRPIIVSAT